VRWLQPLLGSIWWGAEKGEELRGRRATATRVRAGFVLCWASPLRLGTFAAFLADPDEEWMDELQ
jgi:hypothetical protein